MAAEAAIHAYNRTPHKKIGYDIPIKRLNPNINCHFESLRRFGCIAYARLPSTRTKFSQKALRTVFVGYTSMGYVLWHPETGRFLVSRHVRFNERLVYRDVYKREKSSPIEVHREENDPENESLLESTDQHEGVLEGDQDLVTEQPARKRGRPVKRKVEEVAQESVDQPVRKQPCRSAKDQHLVIKARLVRDTSFAFYTGKADLESYMGEFDDSRDNSDEDELAYVLLAAVNRDPTSLKEALQTANGSKWKQATDEEFQSMAKNQVWKLVPRPTSTQGWLESEHA